MPLGSIGQLDLSAPHCEAAVELAGLLERRRELEQKLGQVGVDERSAAQEAQRPALDEFVGMVGPGVASSARAVRRSTEALGRRVERLD